ncbi:MAG: 1-acyl-sn-glycerol-3-phosphate acyltransferase [Alphaproteobacteria bacterium]
MHIVEQLIQERARNLMARERLFKLVRPLLYRMLSYGKAVEMADSIHDKSGHASFDLVTRQISPKVTVTGLESLPATGRCILISNHPTGLADGMAIFKAIHAKRPEHVYLANADALRVMPSGDDIIIPVEWVKDKRSLAKTKQTLMAVKAALEAEKCVVIFPSGVLATMGWKGLTDKPWESSAAMLAKKYNAPVIPLHIKARNSWLYYLLSLIHNELRDITLFQELLNKKGYEFGMTFGEKIDPQSLPKNADEATAIIRHIVEGLGT